MPRASLRRQEVTTMIPPAGVLPVTTLGATFGPAAMLGTIAVVVALAVLVLGLLSERHTFVLRRRADAVATTPPLAPVDDYVSPWAPWAA
jgi:hypothetical protein